MTALLGVTYDYPSVQPPPPAEAPSALEFDAPPTGTPSAPPRHAPWRGCERGRGRGRVLLCDVSWIPKVLDLFERSATPIGTIERAEAALAAARAMQSPGIIKVEPGSTVKRSQPKGDDSLREAAESKAAMVNLPSRCRKTQRRRTRRAAPRRRRERRWIPRNVSERSTPRTVKTPPRARVSLPRIASARRESSKTPRVSTAAAEDLRDPRAGPAPAAGSRPPRSRPRSNPVPRAISGEMGAARGSRSRSAQRFALLRAPRAAASDGAGVHSTGWKPPWR